MNTYGNLMVKLNAFNPPLKDSQIDLIKKIKEIDNE
jgi:N-acetylmuramic acid 6-phosphate (MurNAc-6-P) etherase